MYQDPWGVQSGTMGTFLSKLVLGLPEHFDVSGGGGCCGSPFKGYQGISQGDPLYPTLLNLVVDAVVRHWLIIVEEYKAVPVVLGRLIHRMA